MSTVRVNLLKPAECRYQGVVSREFAVRVSLWGGGALLGILLIMSIVNRHSVKSQLAVCRESWVGMEPRYDRARAMQAEMGRFRAVDRELQAWREARLSWNDLLLNFQSLVPAEVQLTKVYVRGDLVVMGGDGRTEGAPARKFTLSLDGQTAGDLADEVVVNFLATLRERSKFADSLESIKLRGLQRSPSEEGVEAQRVFGIEGVTHARAL